MKTIVRAGVVLSKRQYIIFCQELNLRRVFPAVYFVNRNIPEDQSRILVSEEEIFKFPDDSRNIFKNILLIGT